MEPIFLSSCLNHDLGCFCLFNLTNTALYTHSIDSDQWTKNAFSSLCMRQSIYLESWMKLNILMYCLESSCHLKNWKNKVEDNRNRQIANSPCIIGPSNKDHAGLDVYLK